MKHHRQDGPHERPRANRGNMLTSVGAATGLAVGLMVPSSQATSEQHAPRHSLSMEAAAQSIAGYAVRLFTKGGSVELPPGTKPSEIASMSWHEGAPNGGYSFVVQTGVRVLPDKTVVPNQQDPLQLNLNWGGMTASGKPYSVSLEGQRDNNLPGDPWQWSRSAYIGNKASLSGSSMQNGTLSPVPANIIAGIEAVFAHGTCQDRLPLPGSAEALPKGEPDCSINTALELLPQAGQAPLVV